MSSRIVCGVGVPHVPAFPEVAAAGDLDISERYTAVRRVLEHSAPSLVVVISTDHLNTFFLDRLPTFAIALGQVVRGPVDEVPGIASGLLPTDPAAAAQMANSLVPRGYDLLLCREAEVDHSVVVPLHFLTAGTIPVVVLYVNGYVPPLPSAGRCHQLGMALAAAVEELPGDRRVAVIASGSFSQEVGGPRVDKGRSWSVPRPDWASRVAKALAANDVDTVLAEATPELLADAGSVAGELLSWITMIGAAGPHGARLKPKVDHRPGEAFAFGTWEGR